MIGLPLPGEQQPARFPKSHKFAEHLAGRFHVSGVSGSFRNTRRERGGEEGDTVPDVTVAMAAKQASRLRKEEKLRQDAQRMYELESKLREVCFFYISLLLCLCSKHQ